MAKPPELSAEDARSLVYFWEQKDDLERFAGWEDIQKTLREHHPEIIVAWSDYKSQRRIITAVLQLALKEAEEREDE